MRVTGEGEACGQSECAVLKGRPAPALRWVRPSLPLQLRVLPGPPGAAGLAWPRPWFQCPFLACRSALGGDFWSRSAPCGLVTPPPARARKSPLGCGAPAALSAAGGGAARTVRERFSPGTRCKPRCEVWLHAGSRRCEICSRSKSTSVSWPGKWALSADALPWGNTV